MNTNMSLMMQEGTKIYQEDQIILDSEHVSEYKDPIFGDVTVFHDVPIASEIVHEYPDGMAWKSRKELQDYAWTAEGRWVTVGGHPDAGIVSDRAQVHGRTVNVKYVKNLVDPKTDRPNRAGVKADVEFFNSRIAPETLKDMKNGKKQDVSIGFFYTKDDKPGEVDEDGPCKGLKYDYAQRNLFHDHLAAGIDNGRCPSPYCGLSADEIKRKILVGDPFAGFKDFEACVAGIMKENPDYSREQAEATCGMLKKKYEDTVMEDHVLNKAMNTALHALLRVMDEIEEAQGELDAIKETKQEEWWRILDWRTGETRSLFYALNADTRRLIKEAGLCPTCGEDKPRSEAERAMSHFELTEEEWNALTEEEQQEYIDKLPPKGSGGDGEQELDGEAFDEYEQEYVEADSQWTYAYKASLPDSAYAYIESGCEKEDGKTQQSCRHMPLKNKEGNYDAGHVRAALSALKGGRTGKVPPYASKAKGKVCAGAKALKIESEVCGTVKKKGDVLDPYEVLRRADTVLGNVNSQ